MSIADHLLERFFRRKHVRVDPRDRVQRRAPLFYAAPASRWGRPRTHPCRPERAATDEVGLAFPVDEPQIVRGLALHASRASVRACSLNAVLQKSRLSHLQDIVRLPPWPNRAVIVLRPMAGAPQKKPCREAGRPNLLRSISLLVDRRWEFGSGLLRLIAVIEGEQRLPSSAEMVGPEAVERMRPLRCEHRWRRE